MCLLSVFRFSWYEDGVAFLEHLGMKLEVPRDRMGQTGGTGRNESRNVGVHSKNGRRTFRQ